MGDQTVISLLQRIIKAADFSDDEDAGRLRARLLAIEVTANTAVIHLENIPAPKQG